MKKTIFGLFWWDPNPHIFVVSWKIVYNSPPVSVPGSEVEVLSLPLQRKPPQSSLTAATSCSQWTNESPLCLSFTYGLEQLWKWTWLFRESGRSMIHSREKPEKNQLDFLFKIVPEDVELVFWWNVLQRFQGLLRSSLCLPGIVQSEKWLPHETCQLCV